MSEISSVQRDERTIAVENAGYKWACAFLMYALLIDGAYRGLIRHEAAWDLMAFVVVGGAIVQTYSARHKALPQGWAKATVLVALAAGVIGAAAAILLLWFRG